SNKKIPEKAAYLILDSGVKDREKAVAQNEKMGFVEKGKTIDKLAGKINVQKEKQTKTLDTWNARVKNKKDEAFDRTTAMDNELSKAPCYTSKIGPRIHYARGGVKINASTGIIDKEGNPSGGLFAAGEVTGGLKKEK
ncbi:FAD-binding protein, partial [Listeria monocytogenes]|uniref:FAD-binding protein n=1 Tax=Listeria monocytogenes TaxID=1639 RepID=UPI000A4CF510